MREIGGEEGGEEAGGADLKEAAAHEAGHVEVAFSKEARVEWARPKRSGTGKTELSDPGSLHPLTRALIAVAGRVAEELVCGLESKSLPPSDQSLLDDALRYLDDPSVTEETLRREVRKTLEGRRERLVRIQAALIDAANSRCLATP